MLQKRNLTQKLEKIDQILEPFGLAQSVQSKKEELFTEIRNYRFRVLLVGGFSSGKSALLNTLTQKSALPEDQAPKTTIATELLWDSQEYMEAVDAEGRSTRFELNDQSCMDPQKYRYLICHLNSAFLQKNSDIVLVDMPGIDSNMECHNKAITQYITRGSAYLLLVSCEDGTLRRSTIDFLQEVAQYPQSLACLISKSDLRNESDVIQVQRQVEQDIMNVYGQNVPMDHVSRDDDVQKKVEQVLAKFQPQALFERKFAGQFDVLIGLAQSLLQTAKNSFSLDISELDNKIEECNRQQAQAEKQMEQKKRSLQQKFHNQVLNSILEDMKDALMAQSLRLTDALTISPATFSSAVNSIIRPILCNSTQQQIEASFAEYVSEINMSFMDERNVGSENLQKSVSDALYMARDSISQAGASLSAKSAQYAQEDGASKRMWQAVTGALAIVTDAINPILELAIVFLPSILDFISQIGQKSKYEELNRKVEGIIPQIIENMRPQIADALNKTCDEMVEKLDEEFSNICAAQADTLNKCRAEKEQRTTNFKEQTDRIDKAIQELDKLRICVE